MNGQGAKRSLLSTALDKTTNTMKNQAYTTTVTGITTRQ